MPISSNERRLVASIAAHESWAGTPNRSARTAPARAALDQKFLDAAEGDPVRAANLRKAHFARLALKSAQSRRKARELSAVADGAEAELDTLGAPIPTAGGGDPPGAPSARRIRRNTSAESQTVLLAKGGGPDA